ncbi:hypothetical protein, partial [Vibrio parahaemolyticus]|uniref:hypothetical protein n=1 Tax=Vibrio parahaemolyticus TaxID=670 RepID=UPI002112DCF9
QDGSRCWLVSRDGDCAVRLGLAEIPTTSVIAKTKNDRSKAVFLYLKQRYLLIDLFGKQQISNDGYPGLWQSGFV